MLTSLWASAQTMKISIFFFLIVMTTGCAKYQFGQGERVFPGGYDRIAIPMFANKTSEVGAETYFTEALRVEFERSHLASVTSKADAQVILEGNIDSITFSPRVQVTAAGKDLSSPRPPRSSNPDNRNPLPQGTVLNKEYVVTVTVAVVARKVADSQELWSGSFNGQKIYAAPLLGTPGISNSSPIYSQNYRVQTIAGLAREMMSEAHDRMTENF